MLSSCPSMLFNTILCIISIMKLIQVLKYLFLIILILYLSHGTKYYCEGVKITNRSVLLKQTCFYVYFLLQNIWEIIFHSTALVWIFVFKNFIAKIYTYTYLYIYNMYILSNHNKSKHKLKRTKCSINEND